MAVNLARNGELTVLVKNKVNDESLVGPLKAALGLSVNAPTGDTCAKLKVHTSYFQDKTTFHVGYTKDSSDPDYLDLLQKGLTDEISPMSSSYPSSWETVWSDAGSNIASLLWSMSEKLCCVLATRSESEPQKPNPVLFCQMNPLPTLDQPAFDEAYYSVRKTTLANMKEKDLKASTDNSAIAVPSVLLTSLVAITTTVAA